MKRNRSDYRVCPRCGATLDAGEVCDCIKNEYSRRFCRLHDFRRQQSAAGCSKAAGDKDKH